MVMEKNRKKFGTSDVDIELDIVHALVGFHVFSGNQDYFNSFFCKGKIICFKIMTPSSTFLNILNPLEIVGK